MFSKVEVLSVCNVASEMDLEDIFDICCDANQPGARVDYLPKEAFKAERSLFKNGAVVVWTGYTTNQKQLVQAVVEEIQEET